MRECPVCFSENMLPYASLEVERLSKQIVILLRCAQRYAKKPDGEMAQVCLRQVGKVNVTGKTVVDPSKSAI